MIAACEEHVEVAIEWFVDEYETAPDLVRLGPDQSSRRSGESECSARENGASARDGTLSCFRCGQAAVYGLVFRELRKTQTYRLIDERNGRCRSESSLLEN